MLIGALVSACCVFACRFWCSGTLVHVVPALPQVTATAPLGHMQTVADAAGAAPAAAAPRPPSRHQTRCSASTAAPTHGIPTHSAVPAKILGVSPVCVLAYSYDSLEGLFFDDTYRSADNTHEYSTSLPQGTDHLWLRLQKYLGVVILLRALVAIPPTCPSFTCCSGLQQRCAP